MDINGSPFLVFVMDVVAVAILGLVLAYAVISNRRGRQVSDRQRIDALRRGDDLRQQKG